MQLANVVLAHCPVGSEIRLRFSTGVTLTGRICKIRANSRSVTFELDQCLAATANVIVPAPPSYRFTIKTALAELSTEENGLYLVSQRSNLSVSLGQAKSH